MKSNKKYFKNIITTIIALVVFIQMNPYFIWKTYNNGSFAFLMQGALFVAVLVVFICFIDLLFKREIVNKKRLMSIVPLIVIWVYMLTTGINNKAYLAIGNYMVLIVMVGFISFKSETKKKIFDKFAIIFAISLVPAILIFICINLGITVPYQYLEPDSFRKVSDWWILSKIYIICILLFRCFKSN